MRTTLRDRARRAGQTSPGQARCPACTHLIMVVLRSEGFVAIETKCSSCGVFLSIGLSSDEPRVELRTAGGR